LSSDKAPCACLLSWFWRVCRKGNREWGKASVTHTYTAVWAKDSTALRSRMQVDCKGAPPNPRGHPPPINTPIKRARSQSACKTQQKGPGQFKSRASGFQDVYRHSKNVVCSDGASALTFTAPPGPASGPGKLEIQGTAAQGREHGNGVQGGAADAPYPRHKEVKVEV
jgi:hypothetical protein